MSRSRAPKQNWLPASLSFYPENLELRPLFFLLLGPNPLPGEPEIGPCSQAGAHWGCHTSMSVHIASQEACFSHSLQPHCMPTGCIGQGSWPAGGAWATGCSCCWDCQM